MQKIVLGLLLVLISNVLGCYSSITRSGYSTKDLKTNLSPCTDIIIKKNGSLSEDVATVVGKIKAGDTGFSFVCSEKYVLGIFRKDACGLEADIVNIIEETQPSFWRSTCYRAKADLLRCKDKNFLAQIKSDPQYTPELVNERSKKTVILNTAGMGAAGVVGGGVLGAGIAVAMVSPAILADQSVSEWRVPTMADLGDDSEWRKEKAESYLTARADFNGDGVEDMARLLINDKENKIGLFLTLESRKDSPHILLESINDRKVIKNVGIRVAPPDRYKTACGKGYRTCKTDEPLEIQINYPAIDLFQYESSNSFFVWDGKDNFRRIWMSD
jgi:hypothetical protein